MITDRKLLSGRCAVQLFLEIFYTGRDNPFQEGIRRDQWKYIRMFDGVEPYTEADVDFSNRKPDFEMLFDLNADPGEMNNLVDSMSDSAVLNHLREKTAHYSDSLKSKREAFKNAVPIQSR